MKDKQKERIILGIDPGTSITGYGVIKIIGTTPELISIGAIDLSKYEDHYLKLKHIFDRTIGIIDEYNPDELAIEAPFYGKNVQSMLKLGRSQGVAMAAALYHNLPIFEYAPLKVKQAITGMGRASKEQVAYFLQKMYGLADLPTELDASDAIAVAFCHHLQQGRPSQEKAYSGWGDFIRKNPDRVK